MTTDLRPFLVAYDYGTGGLWGVFLADASEAITRQYPELTVVGSRPDWMSAERHQSLMSDPYILDAPPRGMLLTLLADRRSESEPPRA
ncbi:hypothetical protein [Microbacterium sp.]|uniref:hypothetical protein n=1 Tax=Microbacterium sp. TaxID=51671 RepID=UPI001ACA15F5|nr:hypothetical protein [Microbacterium sp.]MBN9194418.1 hypothetical protein [Microbacterium sp.]